jgi:hypothetical protein
VGIEAHKKDLFIVMLIGNEPKPVNSQLANEPNAVRPSCGSSSARRRARCAYSGQAERPFRRL